MESIQVTGARAGRSARGLPDAPGPRFLTPGPLQHQFRTRALAFLAETRAGYGDVVGVRIANLRSYLIYHPDHARHVLQENHHNYWKGVMIGRAKPLIGEGLFTSEGDFWRRQRRLAQPAFHRQRIGALAEMMIDATAAMLDRWEGLARTGETFDVSAEMSRLTLRIVGRALFGIDLEGDATEVARALLGALEFINSRVMKLAPVPLFVPLASHRRFRSDLRALDEVVFKIIGARRGEGEREDLLGMLMSARDEDSGESMSDRQLRDEVMTFVLAGHETTALALTWTWYLLGRHPVAEARLVAEVDGSLGGRTLAPDDLPALGYARMVVQEAMRLYPPLPVIGRQTLGEDELGGFRIRAGTIVNLPTHAIHRHPEFWEDPERFDPERFTADRVAARPRFAYLPFSGGPRICIGNEFALLEAQIVTAMVAQHFRIRPISPDPVEPVIRVTLRPRDGLPARLERRTTGETRAGAPPP